MNKMFSKFLMSLLILWVMWATTVIAKLCGLVHWSWWLVLSPAIITTGLAGLLFTLLINMVALASLIAWVVWEFNLWRK